MQALAELKQRLGGLIGRTQQPVLGIDIGSHILKITALTLHQGRLSVLAACQIALPEGAVRGHKILDPGTVAGSIITLLRKTGIKAGRAVVGLPSVEASIKTFSLDMGFVEVDEVSVEQHLLNEMTPYVAYPAENIRLDYEFLRPASGAQDISVLVAATSAEVVLNYQTVLAQAGLQPQCLELEQYALLRAYAYFDAKAWQDKPNPCIALLDFGAQYAAITVIEADEVLYTDEQVIRLEGQNPAEFVQQWAARALTLFYTSGLRSEVDGVVLLGGRLDLEKDSVSLLKASLRLPVIWGDPFVNMKQLGVIDGNKHSYALSCGLALRGLQHD